MRRLWVLARGVNDSSRWSHVIECRVLWRWAFDMADQILMLTVYRATK